ncbi:MAG: four helix bundle protein [Elusimicrobia bacterium]|nr:four helix bundle protein [Candidatus Liberimonas magnetica]
MINEKNVLYNKAYDFAVKIVIICEGINKKQQEYTLSKQLLRSGTSIGANVSEANGAISKQDFSAKMSIAYKECLETKYWLSLLKDTKLLDLDSYKELHANADELAKILFSILKTTRLNR